MYDYKFIYNRKSKKKQKKLFNTFNTDWLIWNLMLYRGA